MQLITPQEAKVLMALVEDRNLTSHTYQEALAEEISRRIPKYYEVMNKIIKKIQLN